MRITHIPTGVVVQCQNERSQTQNKAVAMQLLRSKLIELEERKRAEELAKVRGEVKDVAWGSQIRSYFLHPDQRVKDHRTGHESGDTQGVLDGDIDDFIRDYLNKTAQRPPLRRQIVMRESDVRRDLGADLPGAPGGAGRPRACWSSTTGAGPTSATCSASPTRSTRAGGCTWSRRGRRCGCPGSPGYHWYLVPRVGYPDHDTFHAARAALAELHDELWAADRDRARAHRARRLLDGDGDELRDGARRGPPAGRRHPRLQRLHPGRRRLVAAARRAGSGTRVFIAHGRADPIIEVGFARRARELLEAGGLDVEYRESDVGHQIDPGEPAGRGRLAGRRSRARCRRSSPAWNQTTWLWTVRLIVRCLVS